MKLISIYIENFGCLHQYEQKFGDGLTVIREDNGFGKTTLAEFIRAMFYGFPRAAKTLDKNRRKKYLPWGGGKCGGYLTFELDGTRYRIERTFGTTPRGDTFNLIDLGANRKSARFSEEIGVELFQLDGDSFERSTYMPQVHEAGPLTTDSIRAKLGDLVEDTNDVGNYDKAVAALKNKRSAFVPYRGSGGSVAEARTRISRLQEELDRTEGKRSDLRACREQIEQLQQRIESDSRELAAVREQITRGAQAAAAETVRQQYEILSARCRDAGAVMGAQSHFGRGLPTAEEFEKAQNDCEQYLSVAAELRNAGLSGAEQAQLAQLNDFFADGIPGEEKLEALNRQYRRMQQLQMVADSQRLTAEEQQHLAELSAQLEPVIPDPKEIDQAWGKLERASMLRQENLRLEEFLAEKCAKRKGSAGVIAVLLVGIPALGAGIGLMAAGRFLPGGILLGVGLLAMIIEIFLGVRLLISRERSGELAQLEGRIRAGEAARLEREAECFIRQYSDNPSLTEALDEIREDRAAYRSLRNREAALETDRNRTLAAVEACAAALRAELEPWFGKNCDFEQAILALRMNRSSLLNLRSKQAAAEENAKALRLRAQKLSRDFGAFLSPYFETVTPESAPGQLMQLRRDCDEYARAQRDLTALEKQLTDFREVHREVLDTPAEAAPDLALLKREERQLAERITECTRVQLEQKQLAHQLQSEIDRLPRIRDELEAWQEKKDTDQKNTETLDRTLDYLQKARENLSGNYLGTIQRSFTELLGRMAGEDRERILVTGDLEVQLERQGAARELAFFSAGQTDLVMLCMRFALVDALFADVNPFVILDDPFVNLDDERTAEALALLKDLSQDRQIVYLTCNSSRV